MKKFRVLATMLCVSTMLSAPLSTFAATPQLIPEVYSMEIAPYLVRGGKITANNVAIRADNWTALGQVNKGDGFVTDMNTARKLYNGNYYRQVTMTSGQNNGVKGWVAEQYLGF